MTDEQKAQVAALQVQYNNIVSQYRPLPASFDAMYQRITQLVDSDIPDNEQDVASMQKQLELYDEHHEDPGAGSGILTTLHIVSGVDAGTGSNRQHILDTLQQMKGRLESLKRQKEELQTQLHENQREQEILLTKGRDIYQEITGLGGVVVEPT